MVVGNFKAWQKVLSDAKRLESASLTRFFVEDEFRAKKMTHAVSDGKSEIIVDFSKQLIDDQALQNLLALAAEAGIIERFAEMCDGKIVNTTENQPALHTALRADAKTSIRIGGDNAVTQVHDELAKVKKFVDATRREKRFKNLVNIGIGGSDLGPRLINDVLSNVGATDFRCFFVANIDSSEINAVLAQCSPEETLFVVCSKSFGTAETLANARLARKWLARGLNLDLASRKLADHFVVVTANPTKAEESGVVAANTFKIWPWVGGRYSIASAMSLVPTIAFGFAAFDEFLSGMRSVDEQMRSTKPEQNIALILGLIDALNFGTARYPSLAVVPYVSALRLLPNYLQQLVMESNGKSVRLDGTEVSVKTSPVVWGGVGTNAQHAFMQMLHQGSQTAAVDFIGFAHVPNTDAAMHDDLTANMLAQASALAFGRGSQEAKNDPTANHRRMPGNRPSTVMIGAELSPRSLGAIVAIYEHRVFVHGVVAQINSFDQWGVELGKVLAGEIAAQIGGDGSSYSTPHDSSTRSLVSWYLSRRKPEK